MEIAWQRLDEIQPANEDVISRGTTGLKLYMVAPFLVSLKAWILAHKPPVAPKSDLPLKGLSFPFLLNGNADTFCFLIILGVSVTS
ncbi:mRNA-decapping enzyme subunit 2 [Camellia lanceoleosa]|uniref:mRNA-decapping enzyme subunit 2 n=1 Tax=Camellia lanceoleosa TaxID=1840588 RepID=A0ACC0H1M9_9ERIC|nr:mRNA-decapping enzyme subunit 2 [Camellia lanceoleosa]